MSEFWNCIQLTVPILAVSLLLLPKAEASTKLQFKAANLTKQNQVNSEIINRQSSMFNNFINNFAWETNNNQITIAQINSIKQLEDIKLTDWSYQALKSLIERYGCISGFSDRTYRGEQTVSRAEFAAGLNACLNNIETVINNSEVAPTDVDTILRLMQEFQSDLAILQGRTDGSQARLLDLEATQFSTTTKLKGEAIFGLGSLLSSNENNSTISGSRLRLDLATSFTGKDLLFTRLSHSGFPGFVEEIDTLQGNLAFAKPEDDNLLLETLEYSGKVGDRLKFIIGAAGLEADDIAPTISFLDGDGGAGAISAFGTRNPLYYAPGDAGLGITHHPFDRLGISAGYLASPANESTPGNGLFNGSYSALGQITVAPIESLSLAATYVHSYNQSDTQTGTNQANLQSLSAELFGSSVPTVSNSYGLEFSWSISDRFVVGGRGGLSSVSSLNTLNQQIDRGTQDIWNWAATLAIPDLFRDGSLAGIVIGSEPRVTSSTIENIEGDREKSLHLEAFYQYQLNDHLAITPGLVWITEPDSEVEDPEDLVIGTLRTTFSF
jgi:hypothetical protein